MSGILCIDKPQGFTSFDVVAKMRGIAKTRKIGHGGTLDPMATGVLPLFFEKATGVCDIQPNSNKRYTATFKLGITTDTQDITGEIIATSEVRADKDKLIEVLGLFKGEISQYPPMYSAVRKDGVRLYELARQGKEVERAARTINIYNINLIDCPEENSYTIDVSCSKGTYIRTICHDIGQLLGCGATLTALRRTQSGCFFEKDCMTIETAQKLAQEGRLLEMLRPIDSVFENLPKVFLDDAQTLKLQNGTKLRLDDLQIAEDIGRCCVYRNPHTFVALADTAIETGILRIVKLFLREANS